MAPKRLKSAVTRRRTVSSSSTSSSSSVPPAKKPKLSKAPKHHVTRQTNSRAEKEERVLMPPPPARAGGSPLSSPRVDGSPTAIHGRGMLENAFHAADSLYVDQLNSSTMSVGTDFALRDTVMDRASQEDGLRPYGNALEFVAEYRTPNSNCKTLLDKLLKETLSSQSVDWANTALKMNEISALVAAIKKLIKLPQKDQPMLQYVLQLCQRATFILVLRFFLKCPNEELGELYLIPHTVYLAANQLMNACTDAPYIDRFVLCTALTCGKAMLLGSQPTPDHDYSNIDIWRYLRLLGVGKFLLSDLESKFKEAIATLGSPRPDPDKTIRELRVKSKMALDWGYGVDLWRTCIKGVESNSHYSRLCSELALDVAISLDRKFTVFSALTYALSPTWNAGKLPQPKTARNSILRTIWRYYGDTAHSHSALQLSIIADHSEKAVWKALMGSNEASRHIFSGELTNLYNTSRYLALLAHGSPQLVFEWPVACAAIAYVWCSRRDYNMSTKVAISIASWAEKHKDKKLFPYQFLSSLERQGTSLVFLLAIVHSAKRSEARALRDWCRKSLLAIKKVELTSADREFVLHLLPRASSLTKEEKLHVEGLIDSR